MPTIKLLSDDAEVFSGNISQLALDNLLRYLKEKWIVFITDEAIDIIKRACNIYGLEFKRIVSNTREREYVELRAMLMCYFNEELLMSLPKTGALFGRHHATVIHAKYLVSNRLRSDYDYFLTLFKNGNADIYIPDEGEAESNYFQVDHEKERKYKERIAPYVRKDSRPHSDYLKP